MTTTPSIDPALTQWLDAHDTRLREQLFEFLRIPSVSAPLPALMRKLSAWPW